MEEAVYFVVIVAIALLIGWGLSWIVYLLLNRWVKLKNKHPEVDRQLETTLNRCCKIISPLVILAVLPIVFDSHEKWHVWFSRFVMIWCFIAFGIAICGVLKFAWLRYDSKQNTKHLPLKGIYDVAVGFVWIIVTILAVSVLLDKSPAMLLTGLGAMATVLMLIFKDSILCFVAGIQLSKNDMIRVGDWITVPGTQADGVVTDVNISVVKVLNFDNTTTMLPPYTLVSSSFLNWRSMSSSGIRRITRNILINVTTITSDGEDSNSTNLTRYRVWCLKYLNNHPKLNHTTGGNALTMVRIMPQEAAGLPMQLYCFTDTSVWVDYEAIQSEVIENIIAKASDFDLKVYNYPMSLGATTESQKS